MVRDSILEVISRVVGFAIRHLDDETMLHADLGLDPLDRVYLMIELEERLGVEITDAQADSVVTFGDVLRLPGIRALEP